MNKEQKKSVLKEFLNHMESRGVYLCEIDKFSKEMSIWAKDKPQDSHRTLINVNIKLNRLNKSDVDLEIDKHLIDEK
tara:strand:- start:20 stop:250 length:231 start_codon:yes stop_codon:yes gene_type:complete